MKTDRLRLSSSSSGQNFNVVKSLDYKKTDDSQPQVSFVLSASMLTPLTQMVTWVNITPAVVIDIASMLAC